MSLFNCERPFVVGLTYRAQRSLRFWSQVMKPLVHLPVGLYTRSPFIRIFKPHCVESCSRYLPTSHLWMSWAHPYLDNFVHEVLRLYSQVSSTIRVAMKDDILPLKGGCTDSKGKFHSEFIQLRSPPAHGGPIAEKYSHSTRYASKKIGTVLKKCGRHYCTILHPSSRLIFAIWPCTESKPLKWTST